MKKEQWNIILEQTVQTVYEIKYNWTENQKRTP